MTLREAKWRRCRWPHAIMSAEYERRLTAHIAQWRPMIELRAAVMAGDNEQLRDELVQRGMIALWVRGLERLDTDDDTLVWAVLKYEMQRELRAELYGLLRNGQRLLPGD
ncbi:MAG TPA: hypothetical protein VH277_03000 [Gemmatimonadaceae bacterium]|nr:hypothetical protein [Gemmatimonadaceae bacterium]